MRIFFVLTRDPPSAKKESPARPLRPPTSVTLPAVTLRPLRPQNLTPLIPDATQLVELGIGDAQVE